MLYMSLGCLYFVQVEETSYFLKPLNSREWPRQNFSLQYQYNIKQKSDENKEKYQ